MRYNNAKLRRRNSKETLPKELKAAHNLYQKQIAAEKRAQRQRDTEKKKKECEAVSNCIYA
jgi:ribosomal protein L14E/L6E/L27E